MAESKARIISKAFTSTGDVRAENLDNAGGGGGLDSADVLAISGGAGLDSATVIALSGELKSSIFRINPQSLSINTTIDSAENAHVAGPISFDSGVVLTINGNLVIS